MQSIAYIPGSDGAANASLMTVTDVRAPLASTILVNTVANVPDKFYASMGTPNTFTDPITGETITVISEATAVDFAGHVDGSNIEIDEIAPGYTDNGSEVGDIIIIRPITEWANNIHNILSQSLEDDGKIKESAVTYNPNVFDHVASGCVLTGTGYGSTLAWSLSAGVAYINGKRLTVAAATGVVAASKDTYFDLLDADDGTATLVYTGGNSVANNAASPALAADSLRLGVIVSAASIVAATSINQGQNSRTVPTASATEFMQVTDSLGNLICPRDATRRTLGYREVANADRSTTSGSFVDVTGLKTTVKTAEGRKVKISFGSRWVQLSVSGNGYYMCVEEDGVQIYEKVLTSQGVAHAQNMDFSLEHTPATAGVHTYNLRYKSDAGATFLIKCTGATGAKAWFAVEQA